MSAGKGPDRKRQLAMKSSSNALMKGGKMKDAALANSSTTMVTTAANMSSAQQDVDKMLINMKGLRHTVYSINGDEYTGGWKGFNKHGKGTYKWKASMQIYEGNWEDNKRNGFGTLIVPKVGGSYRMEYSGEWKNDHKHGQGSFFYSEDEHYDGEWRKGKRAGWGVITYANGEVYEGEWVEDRQHGYGVLKLVCGDRYEGEWLAGKKNGSGNFFYEDKGQVYEGVWKDGVPRCGEVKNVDRNAALAPKYVMPEIELFTPETVLEKARENVTQGSAEVKQQTGKAEK